MRRSRLLILATAAASLALLVPSSAGSTTTPAASRGPLSEIINGVARAILPACGLPTIGHAACNALYVDPAATPQAAPSGYGPGDIQSAYKLPAGTGTVAIVDAMDNPNAQSDLDAYRSQQGLPACDAGCFTKLNQAGSSTGPWPAGDTGWGLEISLDLDAVSAACPGCKIILVEANSASIDDLGAAVNTAAKQPGVNAISNSYGASESSGQTGAGGYDLKYYYHPGIAVTVSSGDSGYGVQYPASSPYVTAVGGTSLSRVSTSTNPRGWSETVWGSSSGGGLLGLLGASSGTGSGCSAYEPKPTWQKDTGCSKRTVADVSAVADPATGLAVYDTYGQNGWLVVGGTSLSSPIIAATYAIAGDNASYTVPAANAYAHPGNLFDVTSGSNGSCKSGGLLGLGGSNTYLCQAGPGYDGPTGLGTPNGKTAF